MKRFVFSIGLLCGALGLHGGAFAQDEDPMADPVEDPAADPMADPMGEETPAEPATEEPAGGEMAAEPPKQVRFHALGALEIPIAPEGYTDTAGIGIGVMGGATYGLSPQLGVAGQVGVLYHLPKNDITTLMIPILVGVRYMVTPEVVLGADTGLNIIRLSAEGLESQTNTRIPLALTGGYVLPSGLFFGGGVWIPNLLLTEEGEDIAFGLVAFAGKMF